jgi:hypothetical protein
VLDAVDPGADQSGQRVLAEDVCGHPRTVGVRDRDRLDEHVVGPQRGEVADPAVDPVPHQLDPAVPGAGLFHDGFRQQRRVVQLDAQRGDIALGSGQVPTGAHDAWQVRPLLQ